MKEKQEIISGILVSSGEERLVAALHLAEEWFPANGTQAKILARLGKQQTSDEAEFFRTQRLSSGAEAFIFVVGFSDKTKQKTHAVCCFGPFWYQKMPIFDNTILKIDGDLFRINGVVRQGSVEGDQEILVVPLFSLTNKNVMVR